MVYVNRIVVNKRPKIEIKEKPEEASPVSTDDKNVASEATIESKPKRGRKAKED